jgi:hypothetical protein
LVGRLVETRFSAAPLLPPLRFSQRWRGSRGVGSARGDRGGGRDDPHPSPLRFLPALVFECAALVWTRVGYANECTCIVSV